MLDASLKVLDDLDHHVSRRGSFVAYFGSGEYPIRLRILGPNSIKPGSTGLVRLFTSKPLPLLPGDRFILRESGREETIGGGEVLDVDPIIKASKAKPDRSITRVIKERGWIDDTAADSTLIHNHLVLPELRIGPVAVLDGCNALKQCRA